MKKTGKLIALVLASVMSTSLVMGSGLLLGACTDPENPPITNEDTLSAPSSLSYANGKLTWSAVTGATSYTVTVTAGEETVLTQTVTATELDVSSLEEGSYTASVVAKAEGKTDSAAKTATFTVGAASELEALPTPTGFAYANGKVTWTAVEGATAGYLVKVTKKADSSVAIEEKTVTAAELDVSALEAGEYTVSVTAKAVEGVSLASLPAAYDFTVEGTVENKLATPAGGAVDAVARKVTWNAVANAEEYDVTITVNGKVEEEDTVTTAEYDISFLEDANFTLTVVAKAEGYAASEAYVYTASITAVALEKVTDIQVDKAKTVLSWNHVGGADHFRVILKSGSETVLDQVVTTAVNGVYTVDITSVGVGDYTAEVYAIADEYDVFRTDSEAETFAVKVESIGAYEAVTNLHVDGANLVWDENNALGYEIVVTEKGAEQALDINDAKAEGESFNFLATGLPAGDYTVSVTPKDNRHDGNGTATTYDITLRNVKTFDAEAIAQFDGDTSRGGEHAKAELLTKNGKQVAKVTPTVDGWGRVRSEAFIINYDLNPIVVIDIDEVVIGGYHLQVNVGGTNYAVIRDSMVVDDTIAKFVPEIESSVGQAAGITGMQESYLRLGVDHSTENALNNAETHFNSLSIWYLTEWTEAATGDLEEVAGYQISNGMDVAWGAVENADSYRVTLVKNGDNEETLIEKQVQTGLTLRTRDLAEGEYTVKVSAFNSENALLNESGETSYTFNVKYLAEYSVEDIQNFTYIDGDSRSVGYDEETGAAIIDPEASGWGVMAPVTGVEVNLTNNPFAYVDVVKIEGVNDNAGYISRARYTPEGGDETSIILRNDTVTKSSDDLYIELWRHPDGWRINGNASYRFGIGFINGGQIYVKGIRLVEITEVTELNPDAHTPLEAPSNAKVEKGVLSADTVPGNSAYTPKYSAKVVAEGGAVVSDQTNLSAPSVNLAALSLESGKTYTVTFKALGDHGYFEDSEEYTVEVEYSKVELVSDFTNADTETYKEKNGGDTTVEIKDGKFISTVKNGGWGFNFVTFDLTDILTQIDNDYYLQLLIDAENSTAGATIATRFIYPPTDNAVDTGYGETTVGATNLTFEWRDKILEGNKLAFAFGQGGVTAGDGETKTIVFTGMQFVKFTIK